MRKAVVTGATSFVGHELVKQLLKAGDMVYAIVRPGSPNMTVLRDCSEAKIIPLDLKNLNLLHSMLEVADVFFHLGWDGSGAKMRAQADIQQENVAFTLKAIQAAHSLTCRRFVFTGSQAEYGPQSKMLREDIPCTPVTEYGKAKLSAGLKSRAAAVSLGMAYAHGRIFSVYGPEDHPWTLISECIRGFSKGEEVALSSCEQKWNYLFVEDAARAIIALSTTDIQDADPIYNIAGTDTRVLRDFVEELHALMGGRGKPCYGSRSCGLEKPYSMIPDVGKLMYATGWAPQVTFRDGIQKILERTAKE
jgi:UDP-glucose 4-epimerase